MDYHFVYKDVEGTTTEWDDIQRRFGNLPPTPDIFKPPPFIPSKDPEVSLKSKNWIDERTSEELEALEDDPDIDDNRFLEEYRSCWRRSHQSVVAGEEATNRLLPEKMRSSVGHRSVSWRRAEKMIDLGHDLLFAREMRNITVNRSWISRKRRLAELQAAARIARFGSMLLIGGSDFVREVSQAPSDVWVIVLLFKDGIPECELLLQCLEELAARYPRTKFVKIISTDCIPKYPDHNLPTILIYNNGAVKGTYVGLYHFGSQRCTPEAVALALCKSNPVLNDGHITGGLSKNAVVEAENKRLIEKIVEQHEDEEDYFSN